MKRRVIFILAIACLLICGVLVLVASLGDGVGEEPEGDVAPKASAIDPVGKRFANSFRQTGASETISPDLAFLNEFAGANRQLILRHLATSASWFVGRDRGKMFAYRRAVDSGRWVNNLHGYVSDDHRGASINRFQYRILLGINGPVWADSWMQQGQATLVGTGKQVVDLKGQYDARSQQGYESYLVTKSAGASAEIFEQSASPNRPFTSLALRELKAEFDAVLVSKTAKQRGFDLTLMPVQSMKRGTSELKLLKYWLPGSWLPGYYQTQAYVNPGESGYVHLEAFGATVASKITLFPYIFPNGEDSEEYVGWSADPQEQFFCNVGFYCGEHLLSKRFPLRLELWFAPDSGGPERKLVEKVFRVEESND